MFIDYKVTSTRRLFLSEGTDIEMVKEQLTENPSKFINETADNMGIVENDEYIYENERMVLEEGSIELYDSDEDEATSPDWVNL